jgi:hypothetical protein
MALDAAHQLGSEASLLEVEEMIANVEAVHG